METVRLDAIRGRKNLPAKEGIAAMKNTASQKTLAMTGQSFFPSEQCNARFPYPELKNPVSLALCPCDILGFWNFRGKGKLESSWRIWKSALRRAAFFG